MIQRKGGAASGLKKGLLIGAGVSGLLLLLTVWIASTGTPTQQLLGADFDRRRVCLDAWEQDQRGDLDHSTENLRYFDVILKPGCFSGFVVPPKDWRSWGKEFISNEPERWAAIWFFGSGNSAGPYGPNTFPDYPHAPSNRWRLQGVGTIRYFVTAK